MLRAIPIECLKVQQEEAFGQAAIVCELELRRQCGIGGEIAHLDPGIELQPATARIVHQEDRDTVVRRDIAETDILAIAPKIGESECGLVQNLEEAPGAAAMLDIGPAAFRYASQVEAVAAGDKFDFGWSEAVRRAVPADCVVKPGTAVCQLCR